MSELTERQRFILTLAIHEYIHSATPVGSQTMVKRYQLDMSSATVRNELAFLTDKGYLRQPHTSAGRVPSEEGYRYFVSRLLRETDLPDTTRHTISHQFYQMRNDVEQWMRLAASILASQSHAASLVTSPHPEKAILKHLELISTRGTQVLMVLVLSGGDIRQRFLTLPEPISQQRLSSISERLTNIFQGLNISNVQIHSTELDEMEQVIIHDVVDEMQLVTSDIAGNIYIDGLTNVLSEPEFADSEEARQALRVLEERSVLNDLLERTVLQSNVGGVQVLIGSEGTHDELRQCSVILSRYGAPGYATGILGLLGPMRMPYGRGISTIRFLSTLLSDLVSDTMID